MTASERPGTVPDRARTVLVPVSNPATAPVLLALAGALVDGDEGRVVALAVVTGDIEAENRGGVIDQMEELVEGAGWLPGITFEMSTRQAPTVARGILDAAADVGADMILLGVHRNGGRGSAYGSVVESVISAAHPDVVVVRMPAPVGDATLGGIDRVVVAVEGSDESRAAVRVGLLVGAALGIGVHVVHVQGGEVPRGVGLGTIERSLEGVDGADRCTKELVVAGDVGQGILTRVEPTDLVVLGSDLRPRRIEWGAGTPQVQIVRNAPGPVLVVARRVEGRALAGLMAKVRPTLTNVEQDSILWQSERQAGVGLDFVLLIAVSGLLASFGLLQNSPAVVIGAMLVAPLLGPLNAVSVGLVTARLGLARRAARTVVTGAAIAVGCGWVLGLLVPFESPTAEMLARGVPTLLDAGVALAAGAVGAYATARKEVPAALAGVAIAAALVPPLCAVGLGLAVGAASLALGALLLFTINVISVAVVGGAVFVWFGMTPVTRGIRERRRAVSLTILSVLALVTVLAVVDAAEEARTAVVAEQDLAAEFPTAGVVDLEYEAGEVITLVATLRSSEPVTAAQVALVESGLETRLGVDIDLSVVVQTVVRSAP